MTHGNVNTVDRRDRVNIKKNIGSILYAISENGTCRLAMTINVFLRLLGNCFISKYCIIDPFLIPYYPG